MEFEGEASGETFEAEGADFVAYEVGFLVLVGVVGIVIVVISLVLMMLLRRSGRRGGRRDKLPQNRPNGLGKGEDILEGDCSRV